MRKVKEVFVFVMAICALNIVLFMSAFRLEFILSPTDLFVTGDEISRVMAALFFYVMCIFCYSFVFSYVTGSYRRGYWTLLLKRFFLFGLPVKVVLDLLCGCILLVHCLWLSIMVRFVLHATLPLLFSKVAFKEALSLRECRKVSDKEKIPRGLFIGIGFVAIAVIIWSVVKSYALQDVLKLQLGKYSDGSYYNASFEFKKDFVFIATLSVFTTLIFLIIYIKNRFQAQDPQTEKVSIGVKFARYYLLPLFIITVFLQTYGLIYLFFPNHVMAYDIDRLTISQNREINPARTISRSIVTMNKEEKAQSAVFDSMNINLYWNGKRCASLTVEGAHKSKTTKIHAVVDGLGNPV